MDVRRSDDCKLAQWRKWVENCFTQTPCLVTSKNNVGVDRIYTVASSQERINFFIPQRFPHPGGCQGAGLLVPGRNEHLHRGMTIVVTGKGDNWLA